MIDDFYDPFLDDGAQPKGLQRSDEILREMRLFRPRDEGDDPAPPNRNRPCRRCAKVFLARWGWFCGQWRETTVCDSCAGGNTFPPGFITECYRARTRQLACPQCGIKRGVDGVLENNAWSYHFTCQHCGAYALNIYRVKRKCTGCQDDFYIYHRPVRHCKKCRKENTENTWVEAR